MTEIRLERAQKEDCRDLWLWRNDEKARKNFFDDRQIPWPEHEKWFDSCLKSGTTHIYVAKRGAGKIGAIRFDAQDNKASVSINLNPDFMGQGYGSEIIKSATEKVLSEASSIRSIIAEIKKGNIASQKAFSKAGYKLAEETKEKIVYKWK